MTFRFSDDIMRMIYGIKETPVPVYFDAKDLTEIAKLSTERVEIMSMLEQLNSKYQKTSRIKVYFYDRTDSFHHTEDVMATGGAGVEILVVLQNHYADKLKVVDEQLEAYGVKVRT